MKQVKVIDPKNLPARYPVTLTLSVFMALDYYNAPQWLCGAFGVLGFSLWVLVFTQVILQIKTDIFNDGKDNT